jgi:hypothetical protein
MTTRTRTVNGMKQTVTVEKSETINGATIEICKTDKGYPMIRVERVGKEAYIVPGLGELAIPEATKIVEANFLKACENAKAGA